MVLTRGTTESTSKFVLATSGTTAPVASSGARFTHRDRAERCIEDRGGRIADRGNCRPGR